jgi:hypothetical protein
MTDPPDAEVLDPEGVARWLDTDVEWVRRAIDRDELPVLGYRSDGVPLMARSEIRAWLRRPTAADDES